MTEQSKTEQALRDKIAVAFKMAREEGVLRHFANGMLDADEVIGWVKEAGYKSPQECEACKEATNAVRKVYESLIPGKFDLVIQKPVTGMPQVGQFPPEEYQPSTARPSWVIYHQSLGN